MADQIKEDVEERIRRLEQVSKKDRNLIRVMLVVIIALCAGYFGVIAQLQSKEIEARRIVFRDSQGHALAQLGVRERLWDGKQKIEWPELTFFDENGQENMKLNDLAFQLLGKNQTILLGEGYVKDGKLGGLLGLHVVTGDGEVALTSGDLKLTHEDNKVDLTSYSTAASLSLEGPFSQWHAFADPEEAVMLMQHSRHGIAMRADAFGWHIDH